MTKSMVCAFALILEFTSPALSPLEGFTGVFIWVFFSLCTTISLFQIFAAANALLNPPLGARKGERQARVPA